MPAPVTAEIDIELINSSRGSVTAYAAPIVALGVANAKNLIDAQLQETKERQQAVNKLRELKQKVRSGMQNDKGVDWSNDENMKKLVDLARDLGVDIPKGYHFSKDDLKSMSDNLKTTMDTLNSSNEMDMLRMQRLMNMMNNLIQMLSNMESKEDRTKSAINRNIAG